MYACSLLLFRTILFASNLELKYRKTISKGPRTERILLTYHLDFEEVVKVMFVINVIKQIGKMHVIKMHVTKMHVIK